MAPAGRHQVVVGVDGSPHARLAMRWASRFALLLDADVTAVHGTGLLDHVDGRLVPAHAHIDEIRRALEEEWCGRLDRTHLPHRVEVVERPAVDALLAAAHEGPTDLVVVGTRGRGIPRAQALGSTALQLLRQATVPVLVVPGPSGDRSVELRRLVIGVDGSVAAQAALLWASGLACLTGARCEVVAVAEDDPVFPLGTAATVTAAGEEDAPDRLRAIAEQACESLRDLGVTCEVTVRRGTAADALLGVARDRHADLVVVGSSGEGSAGNPLLGSVSRQVAHDAGRPVAVVPHPGHRHPGAHHPASAATAGRRS
ncbi:MAG TPA: universal stress protein [Acidimicrobiales bacterium]|nr:universal stress protein [Acidimicrobiales bacterium]